MPSWRDLENYLKRNGYTLVRSTGVDLIYERISPNGDIERVRVSKGTGEISKGLFSRILKQQLGGISKEDFNKGK